MQGAGAALFHNGLLKLSPTEWKVVQAYPKSLNLAKVAAATGLPYSTVVEATKRLWERGIRVSFNPRLGVLGAKPLLLVYEGDLQLEPPPYTVYAFKGLGKVKLHGFFALVPEPYVDDYLAELGRKPLVEVIGVELRYWDPNGRLTGYEPGLGVVVPDHSRVEEVVTARLETAQVEERRWVDWVDLLILSVKMNNAYAKLSPALSRLKGVHGPLLSRQLISYHFRMHVVPLWGGNVVRFKLPGSSCPERIYLLRGKGSRRVAGALVEAPYFYEALIGEELAAVLAQPPCAAQTLPYEVLCASGDAEIEELILTERKSFEWLSSRLLQYYRDHGTWPPPSQASA
ncbi:MAG: hypothetical protein QXI90_07145 [Thermofilum sp.]